MNNEINQQLAIQQFAMIWNYNAHVEHQYNIYCWNSLKTSTESKEKDEVEDEEGLSDNRIKKSIINLKEERLLKHLYDYTWIMQVMNDTKDMPHFDSPQSFLDYLKMLGIESLPEVSSLKKAYGKVIGKFPEWTFLDADATETNRRINVAKRFMSEYRKGNS